MIEIEKEIGTEIGTEIEIGNEIESANEKGKKIKIGREIIEILRLDGSTEKILEIDIMEGDLARIAILAMTENSPLAIVPRKTLSRIVRTLKG